jgi:hypothetical protein
VVFNDKLKTFAKHWGFRPRASAPYRARRRQASVVLRIPIKQRNILRAGRG